MKNYNIFASVYESVDIMRKSYVRDKALDILNNSKPVNIKAEYLNDAVDKYMGSNELEDFVEGKERAYFYFINEEGNPIAAK